MQNQFEKIARILDWGILIGSVVVIFAWLIGKPLFYSTSEPVMSIFTAISLLILSFVRLATKRLYLWPFTLSVAFLLIVAGGNLSSIMMLTSAAKVFVGQSSSIVMTSVFTSIALILFCTYELLVLARKTPKSIFIIDDILIHLALVPGALSLIGYLYKNPTYLSMDADPRVGISLLEMFFMAALALAVILSNPNLFLWEFLKGSLTNKIVFAVLFINQYVAPLVYLYVSDPTASPKSGLGLEVFIMFGGVIATLGFLILQAFHLFDTEQPSS